MHEWLEISLLYILRFGCFLDNNISTKNYRGGGHKNTLKSLSVFKMYLPLLSTASSFLGENTLNFTEVFAVLLSKNKYLFYM